ncbi:trace amine-associated receptor 2-like [Strongylocentrotus purpuratus]|uniref:G-protein coupled receptors family 1 profile domain-containing protein n=1 Tax=Strongylocentrotus purpuratus TaxID=7668 RepID=A0A7M7NYA6_STRPU|nr:trace amine-associated receptor 2-like [Strongylocentrotus purpuratus]
MNLSYPVGVYAVIFYSLQFIFGIPGNVLIIVVYSRKKRKISTDILIIAQGTIDLVASLLAPINILKSVSDRFTIKAICRIALFGNNSLAFASLFLTAAIAFDRFFFVCRPYGKRASNKQALCLAVICWIFGSSLTCTKLIYVDAYESRPGELTCLVVDTQDFLDTLEAWLKTSGFVFALVTSVVMYGRIYQTIKKQVKIHAQLVGGVSNQMHKSRLSTEALTVQSTELQLPIEPRYSSLVQSVKSETLDKRKDNTNEGTTSSQTQPNLLVINNGNTSATFSISNTIDHRSQPQPKAVSVGPTCPRPKRSDRGENRTTKMLMAVTTILLASWLPPIVFFHLRDSILVIIEGSIAADTLVYIGKSLPGINHIINYFVFTSMNKSFRMDCKRLFRA